MSKIQYNEEAEKAWRKEHGDRYDLLAASHGEPCDYCELTAPYRMEVTIRRIGSDQYGATYIAVYLPNHGWSPPLMNAQNSTVEAVLEDELKFLRGLIGFMGSVGRKKLPHELDVYTAIHDRYESLQVRWIES